MARDGRVVQLVDGGAEALAAVAIGGASAGYRVVVARQSDPDDAGAGRHRARPARGAGPARTAHAGERRPAVPSPGGSGDPDVRPGSRPVRPAGALRPAAVLGDRRRPVVTDAAVETLRARGEPARMERLFGEILVGLDRSGQLRRLATGTRPSDARPTTRARRQDPPAARTTAGQRRRSTPTADRARRTPSGPSAPAVRRRARRWRRVGRRSPPGVRRPDAAPDPVERLLALIRDELAGPTSGASTEIEPGRWWLAETRRP